MNSSLERFSRLLSAPLHGVYLSQAPRGSDTLNLRITNKKCLFFSSRTKRQLSLLA